MTLTIENAARGDAAADAADASKIDCIAAK